MRDERDDAAVVVELVTLAVPLVITSVMTMPPLRKASSRRRCASVSKLKTVVSKICVCRAERDLRAAPLRRAGDLEPGRRNPALVRLRVDLAVAPDLEIERLGQRVDHRNADAVEAAGHLVAVVVELAAGVQNGQHDFRRRLAAGVAIHGNAAAVVDHRASSRRCES